MNTKPSTPEKSGKTKWWLLGCGSCLAFVVVSALAIGYFVFSNMGSIKNTGAYVQAKERAENSAVLQEAIGTPMKESFPVIGWISNGDSKADFAITLTGSKASAVVTVNASKSANASAWDFAVLKAQVADGPEKGKEIDLK